MGKLRCLPSKLGSIGPRVSAPTKKATDPHYGTQAHKDWAADVVRRAGFSCEDCGAKGVKLYADHIREISDGGAALDPMNGCARCARCHGKKTAAERVKRLL